MAILDTFISIFTADTEGMKEGGASVKRTTDQMVKDMESAEKGVGNLQTKFLGFAKAAAGAWLTYSGAQRVAGIASEQATIIRAMGQTADAIGVAVEELDAFNFTMGDSLATAEASEGALAAVYRTAGQAAMRAESEHGKMFAALGMSVKDAQGNVKNAIDLMLDVAGAAEGLDRASAINIFQKLGITDRKVQEGMLKGRRALEDQMRAHKAAGVVTEEQAEMAEKYAGAQNDLGDSLDRGSRLIMVTVLPIMTKLVQITTVAVDWIRQNKNVVIGFFTAIAAIIAAVYLPAMISAATATLAATWPIIAIAAVVLAFAAACALVYDDIMNWIDGNDSLIGQMMNDYPMVEKLVNDIVNAFIFLKDVLVGLWDFSGLFAQHFIAAVQAIGDAVANVFNAVKGIVTDAIEYMMGRINTLINAGKAVASLIGAAGRIVTGGASPALASASSSPLNATTSGTITNSKTEKRTENNVSIGQLQIQTQATDAQGVAAGAKGALAAQLKNLNAESASGVAR